MKVLLLAILIVAVFTVQFNKVEPEVFAELDLHGGETDIFVEFKEKVNFKSLAKGQDYDDMEESKRGKLVFESLYDIAQWTQAPLKAYLTERKVQFTSFYIDNLIYIPKANKRIIDYVASRLEVKSIYRNIKINLDELEKGRPAKNLSKAVEVGIQFIKAPAVWKHTKGKGIVIANSDTGVNMHEAIKDTYRGKDEGHDYNWMDGSRVANTPVDSHGHGTHCMGTKVGHTSAQQIGVSPESTWMACRSLGPGASAQTVLRCLEFFLAPTTTSGQNPNPDKRPHVTSHSYLCRGCRLENAVNALLNAGVEVVVAAGNSGSGCRTITEPALYENSLAVGALNPNDHTAARFSSRGPVGQLTKPNVAAPGVNVLSCGRTSGYVRMSGTSMAAPHVAGAIGLLWSGKQNLVRKIKETREIFYKSAHKQQDGQCGNAQAPNNVFGWGTINLEEAWKAAF